MDGNQKFLEKKVWIAQDLPGLYFIDRGLLNSHFHGDLRVWFIIADFKIVHGEVVDVRNFSFDLEGRERAGSSLELKGEENENQKWK